MSLQVWVWEDWPWGDGLLFFLTERDQLLPSHSHSWWDDEKASFQEENRELPPTTSMVTKSMGRKRVRTRLWMNNRSDQGFFLFSFETFLPVLSCWRWWWLKWVLVTYLTCPPSSHLDMSFSSVSLSSLTCSWEKRPLCVFIIKTETYTLLVLFKGFNACNLMSSLRGRDKDYSKSCLCESLSCLWNCFYSGICSSSSPIEWISAGQESEAERIRSNNTNW